MNYRKIDTGNYQKIKHFDFLKENRIYDIIKVEFTRGENGRWDVFINKEWSNRFDTMTECKEYIRINIQETYKTKQRYI